MSEARFKESLTPAQARQAIYIDFEGRTNEAPVLLGALYNESRRKNRERLVLCQYVVDPDFAGMEGLPTFDGIDRCEHRVLQLKTAMNDIIRRASKQNRKIVSWSQHDRNQVVGAEIARVDQLAFDANYVDGKAMAKRWMNAHHPDARPDWESRGGRYKLMHFLPLVDIALPDGYGSGQIGTWLKTSRDAITARASWAALLDSQRARWLAILRHNAFDCLAAMAVVRAAVGASPGGR